MAGNQVTSLKDPEGPPYGLYDKLLNNLGSMADILNGCTCPILSSSSIETIGNDQSPDYFNFTQWPTSENLSRTEYFPDYNTNYNTAVNGVLAYNIDPDNSGLYTMVAAGPTASRQVNFRSGIYETPASVQFEHDAERDAVLSCAACKQQLSRYISENLSVPGDVEHKATRGRDDVDDYVINCWYDKRKNGIICSYEPKDTGDTDTTESGSSCSQPKTARKSVVPNPDKIDIDKLPNSSYSVEGAPEIGVNTDLSKTCSLFLGPGHSHPKLMGDVNGNIEGKKIAKGKRGDKTKLDNNETDGCSLNTVCTENGSKKVYFQQDSKAADSDSKWIAESKPNERREAKAKKAEDKCIVENKVNERKEAEAKKADEKYIAENELNERREEEKRRKNNEDKAKKGTGNVDDKKSKAVGKEKRKECDLKAKSVKKDEQKRKEKEVKCAGRVCHSRICGELCALTKGKKAGKEEKHVERRNRIDMKDTEKNKEKRDRRCNHSSVKRPQSTPDDTAIKRCFSLKKTPSPINMPTTKVSFKNCKISRVSKSPSCCDTDSRKSPNAKRSNSSQTSHHKIKAKNQCEGRARSQIKKSLGKFIKFEGGNTPDVEPKRSCLCAFVCERSKNECGKRVCCSEVKKKRSKSEMDLSSRPKSGKGHEVVNKEHWAGSFQMTFDTEKPQLMPVKQCWSKNSREVIEDAIKKLEDIEKKSLSGIMTPPRVCADEDPQFYDAVDSAHMNTSESNTPRGDLTRDPSVDQKSMKNEPPSC